MEAFKAANPHATLEDFVRWHSPRDWIPDGGDDPDKGRLSSRMLKEGNFWQNLWEVNRASPVVNFICTCFLFPFIMCFFPPIIEGTQSSSQSTKAAV